MPKADDPFTVRTLTRRGLTFVSFDDLLLVLEGYVLMYDNDGDGEAAATVRAMIEGFTEFTEGERMDGDWT